MTNVQLRVNFILSGQGWLNKNDLDLTLDARRVWRVYVAICHWRMKCKKKTNQTKKLLWQKFGLKFHMRSLVCRVLFFFSLKSVRVGCVWATFFGAKKLVKNFTKDKLCAWLTFLTAKNSLQFHKRQAGLAGEFST